MDDATLTFDSHRRRLQGIAYRMLGSVAEAEEVVQDAWLRWHEADKAGFDSAEAWLVTVVTRLSIDRLRAAKVQREHYIGAWMPEPVLTDAPESPEQLLERADNISVAFLAVLERLAPEARAAFLLREVFDADYADVARVLETTPANARQLVHRAKTRVAEGRPRFEASPERQREMVTRFFDAVRGGSLASLEQFLAADVTFTSDGGGKAPAAMRPVIGAASVAKLISGLWQKLPEIDPAPEAWRLVYADINGEAAALIYRYEKLESVFVFSTDADRITTIRVVRNPDKLAWLAAHREPPAES